MLDHCHMYMTRQMLFIYNTIKVLYSIFKRCFFMETYKRVLFSTRKGFSIVTSQRTLIYCLEPFFLRALLLRILIDNKSCPQIAHPSGKMCCSCQISIAKNHTVFDAKLTWLHQMKKKKVIILKARWKHIFWHFFAIDKVC